MAVDNTLLPLLLFIVQWIGSGSAVGEGKLGTWQLLLNNTGVVAMHMALTRRNTVVIFDQTSSGPSSYALHRSSDGRRCYGVGRSLTDPNCSAHSVEYNIARNSIRPLKIQTDTWCSSGSFLSTGTLLQTGGYGDGYRKIRYFNPCPDANCDWRESRSPSLTANRWYASNLLLPQQDRAIVVGGLRTFTYEFVPRRTPGEEAIYLPFLYQTNDRDQHGNNLYPFVHLSADGNLFIFANRDSILFDYRRNRVLKTFPRIPGHGSRNYPSSGSSIIFPLDHADGFQRVEVMVCGGSVAGAYPQAQRGNFLTGLNTCGRMVITGDNHYWRMEEMPGPRLLNDMLILPTGDILIINGAKQGAAGWNNAASPSLQPYLYTASKPRGQRFSLLRSAAIPRLYHSSAVLLPDGRVLVAGSNPNNRYAFNSVAFPTELRLESFTPYYMNREYDTLRPRKASVHYPAGEVGVRHGEDFKVRFALDRRPGGSIEFSMYAPPFATHGTSMNQRMLKLNSKGVARLNDGWLSAVVEAPPSPNVAPAGYYMLTVLNGGIPSVASWVRLVQE